MILSVTRPNQIYQHILSQGLLLGFGFAMVFTPALAIISHYFHRRRAIAFALIACGSSLGGVLFPIIYQRLFTQIGFAWSVRVVALICLLCLSTACLLLKTRLPLRPTTSRELLAFVDLGGFKDGRYCFAAASTFL
jgi:MCP family monocarboxylic acid transporter-like MFS transporter 10